MSIGRGRGGLDGPFRRLGASGGAAVLVLAVLAPAAPAQVTIGGIQVRPSPFSPNGDGLADSIAVLFTPGGAGDSVTVQVTPVRESDQMAFPPSLPSTTVPVGGEIESFWSPGPIADGHYRFDIVAHAGTDSAFASAGFVADTSAPIPSIVNIQPNPFDPGAVGPDDLPIPVEIAVSVASDTLGSVASTLHIRFGGNVVRTVGTYTGVGDSTFTWNGRNAGGAALDDGVYEAYLESVDVAQNIASASRLFTLDADPPTIDVDQRDPFETTSLPVVLTGTARDVDRVTMMEASIDSGRTFGPIGSMSPPDSVVDWQLALSDSLPFRYDVVIRAWDAAAHFEDEFLVVGYDSVAASPVSSSVVGSGSVRSGTEIEILTEWNRPSLEVTADFSDLDSGFDGRADRSPFEELGNGEYRMRYEITAANNRVPGLRRIVITGSTGFVSDRDTLRVTLEPRLIGDQLVSIDRNRFDPGSGEEVQISARFQTLDVVVWIYDLSGRRVRFLEDHERGTVRWDGRDDNQEAVSSGVYFLKVKVGDEEELRKVAVMRRKGP